MSEEKLRDILDFRKIISIINSELKSKGIYDCEYMLINNSIEDVIHIIVDQSEYYQLIKDDKYDKDISFIDLLEQYFISVQKYYSSILIKEGNNDSVADKYYSKLVEPTKKDGEYIHYDKANIGMIQSEVKKTLILMKEALQTYYKVYNNKELVAELSTNNSKTSEYMEFQIKEEQLLHLLGVTANQLRDNPDFQRLTGNKYMNSIQLLEWILTDIDGNNDLLQYNDDFLKKIQSAGRFDILSKQYDSETQSQLLNYSKIRSKAQTFLKYGPLEKVSLVSKLQNGKTLSRNSKSNAAMITRAESFRKYPWAYFGSVQETNNKYIETLQIDSSDNKKELFKYSKPAIVKGIYVNGDEGSGTPPKLFSEEEQFELFLQAYDSFSNSMDFTNLIEYFSDLERTYINDSPDEFKRTK